MVRLTSKERRAIAESTKDLIDDSRHIDPRTDPGTKGSLVKKGLMHPTTHHLTKEGEKEYQAHMSAEGRPCGSVPRKDAEKK